MRLRDAAPAARGLLGRDPIGRRWAIALGVIFAVALGFYLPHAPAAPLSDDWPTMVAMADIDRRDIAGWLDPTARGWFRPLSDLYSAVTWQAFGRNTLAHFGLAATLFAATAVLIAAIAASIADDRRVGVAAAAVFVSLPAHAEPVLWTSANNELLAGLLAAAAVGAAWRYVNHRAMRWLALGTVLAFSSVLAKETGLGVPFVVAGVAALAAVVSARAGSHPPGALPAGDGTDPPSAVADLATADPRLLLAPLAIALAGAAVVLLRAGVGLAYDVGTQPTALLRNVAYSAGIVLAAVPASGERLLPRPDEATWLAEVGSVVVGAISIAALAGLWIALRAWRRCPGCALAAAVGVGLMVAGLAPGAPIVSERTTFVATLGASVAVGAAAVAAFGAARTSKRGLDALAVVLLVSYVAANAVAAQARGAWWHRAGDTVQSVMTQLAAHAEASPAGTRLAVSGLPERVGPAVAFLNAFPAAAEAWPIARRLSVAAPGPGDDDQPSVAPDRGSTAVDPVLFLVYRDGRLSPIARSGTRP